MGIKGLRSKWREVPAKLYRDPLCSAHPRERSKQWSDKVCWLHESIQRLQGCQITAKSCRVTEQQKCQMKFNICEGKMMYPKKLFWTDVQKDKLWADHCHSEKRLWIMIGNSMAISAQWSSAVQVSWIISKGTENKTENIIMPPYKITVTSYQTRHIRTGRNISEDNKDYQR